MRERSEKKMKIFSMKRDFRLYNLAVKINIIY